jgi:hypothetical protein
METGSSSVLREERGLLRERRKVNMGDSEVSAEVVVMIYKKELNI